MNAIIQWIFIAILFVLYLIGVIAFWFVPVIEEIIYCIKSILRK